MTIPLLHDGLPVTTAANINDAIAASYADSVGKTYEICNTRVASYSALRALSPVNTSSIYLDGGSSIGDGAQGNFRGVTGAAAGTYVDNGSTIIVPTGGDGSAAWLRVNSNSLYEDFILSFAGAVSRTVAAKLQEVVSVLDFGADPTGAADSTAAFNNSPYFAFAPAGTYNFTGIAPTSPSKLFAQNAHFTGTNSFASWVPLTTLVPVAGISTDSTGGVLGAVLNNSAANTTAFPTGVSGYGRTNNAGNTAYGIFGRADLYNTGVAVNELNSFNYFAAPSTDLPPNLSIGTTAVEPITLTLAAGGNYQSSMALNIASEGSVPNTYRNGIYFNPGVVTNYGINIDATATAGPTLGILLKHPVNNVAMQIQGVGTPVSGNAYLTYVDGAGVTQTAFNQNGSAVFNGQVSAGGLSATTTGATQTITAKDTGGNGAGLALQGNGATTPNKTIRSAGGVLQVVNSAYTGVILSLTDSGSLQVASGIVGTGAVVGAKSASANSTVGASTLTAAQMLTGNILRSGSTAAYTDTTDTAANIVASIPNAVVGIGYELTIANTVAFTETIAAGAGVTLAGTTLISASSSRKFVVTITDVTTPAVTITGVSSGGL